MPVLHNNFYTGIFGHTKISDQLQSSNITEMPPLYSCKCDVRKLLLDAGEELCVAGSVTKRTWKEDL
jgi:hypothetical protein